MNREARTFSTLCNLTVNTMENYLEEILKLIKGAEAITLQRKNKLLPPVTKIGKKINLDTRIVWSEFDKNKER